MQPLPQKSEPEIETSIAPFFNPFLSPRPARLPCQSSHLLSRSKIPCPAPRCNVSTHETKFRIAESHWRAVTPKLGYNLPGLHHQAGAHVGTRRNHVFFTSRILDRQWRHIGRNRPESEPIPRASAPILSVSPSASSFTPSTPSSTKITKARSRKSLKSATPRSKPASPPSTPPPTRKKPLTPRVSSATRSTSAWAVSTKPSPTPRRSARNT